ncbi:UNKNOWN [Stylonychia lemnae]|uniref:Uncharacterized protein n=1 Tax=Stylonychia lemnae TaxID=5949 RepID=A0A078AHV3_STYLE|nr:UNKNOWN [Stylonychia lemnae]|eukprot:CDW81829.1 UNKNOWN [Stylonychia lemnae]
MNTDEQTLAFEFLIDQFLQPYDSTKCNEQQLESPKNLNYFDQENNHKDIQQSIFDFERFHHYPANIEILTSSHNISYLMSPRNVQMPQYNLSNNQDFSGQGLQQLTFNADKITYQDLDLSDLDDDDNKHTQVDYMSQSPSNEILTKIQKKQQKVQVKGSSTQQASQSGKIPKRKRMEKYCSKELDQQIACIDPQILVQYIDLRYHEIFDSRNTLRIVDMLKEQHILNVKRRDT